MSDPRTTLEYSRQPVRRPWWWRWLFLLMLVLASLCVVSGLWPTAVVWASHRQHTIELSRGTIAYIEGRQGRFVNSTISAAHGPETGWWRSEPLHLERPTDPFSYFHMPLMYGTSWRSSLGWTSFTQLRISLVYFTLALGVLLILTDRRSRRASSA